MGQPLLFIAAGDPSGDNATSRVVSSLKSSVPNLEFFGLGGPRLKELGQEQLADSADLAVLGFWEVAKRYFYFRSLFHRCLDEIKTRRPSAVVLVDYPGFNLRLAQRIRPLGIPVVYYISPQVWAWGKRRIRQIQECVDRMLVILPFEEKFYRDNRVPCDFVGHYLLEDIPKEYIASDLPGNKQLALLPGSRPQEIERMLPPMLDAARLLAKSHGTKAVVAGVRGTYDYQSLLGSYQEIDIVYNDARRVLHGSDFALTASGTATLETGIIGRPMVVVYKIGFVTYQIAKHLVDLDAIGLVNLVAGEKIVPELIQHEASPENMAAAIAGFINDGEDLGRTVEKLRAIPEKLGGTGASERTAKLIGSYL